MKILEELYYGNIRPNGEVSGKDSAFAALVDLRERNKEKLLAFLNEEGKDVFEKLTDVQGEMDEVKCCDRFSAGFQLGVMLMVEAFTGEAENPRFS